MRSVRARAWPNAANVAKAKTQKYATAPSRATGIPPTFAYELPNTRKQSVDQPQLSDSPVNAFTVRQDASAKQDSETTETTIKTILRNHDTDIGSAHQSRKL